MAASLPPRALVIRLALAIVLDTAVHMVWKAAVLQLPETRSVAEFTGAALHQPLLLVVAALFVLQLANWLKVLEGTDLSYAQPVTSLSLVSVLALSAFWLGESVDAAKVLGIALVIAGVWFIGRTDHDGGARRAREA